MKCVINGNDIVIYLQNQFLQITDFEDMELLEAYFKDLFLKLKNSYPIEVSGFYNIDVYIDKLYGMILEIKKEDIDFIEYYDDIIDMKIAVHETEFLYQVDDILHFLQIGKCYFYKNRYYIKLKDNINKITLNKMLEFTNSIIYKNMECIIKMGTKI